jgi:hypothetical protein
MFSNGLFSFGLAGPLGLLVLGLPAIGLLCSGVAIKVRIRIDSGLAKNNSQPKIDWAIGVLATSVLLQILGLVSYYSGFESWETWKIQVMIGIFILWPVSAILAVWGRGVGRSVLLMGHGLIAFWVAAILLIILIHGEWSHLMSL